MTTVVHAVVEEALEAVRRILESAEDRLSALAAEADLYAGRTKPKCPDCDLAMEILREIEPGIENARDKYQAASVVAGQEIYRLAADQHQEALDKIRELRERRKHV